MTSTCFPDCCSTSVEGGTEWQSSSTIGVTRIERGTRLFAKQNQHPTPSNRMREISSKERNEAFHDVHGVVTVEDEPLEYIQRKLYEMDMEMLLVEHGDQYRTALSQNEGYVQSLHLAFLRAEDFDTSKASARMARHFVLKEQLFGEEKLGKELDIYDLNPKDRQILDMGYLQFLPEADRSGRGIGLTVEKLNNSTDPEFYDCVTKLFFWMSLIVGARVTDVQKKGIICVHYNNGKASRGDGGRAARKVVSALNSLVIKVRAIHVCYSDPLADLVLGLMCDTMEKRFLCRFQTHFGTEIECQYSLMSFGIPLGVLPLKADGTVDFRHHREWIKRVERGANDEIWGNSTKELEEKAHGCLPKHEDVLLGRGRRGLNWPGNIELRRMVKEAQPRYESVDRYNKQLIAHTIYHRMKKTGAQFLKPLDGDKNLFVAVEQNKACDRIAHLFRNLRASTKGSQ